MQIPYDFFLVTGGAGFIGSHIAEYLSKHGKKVIILDNLVSGKRENIAGFENEFVEGSITDRQLVFDLVSQVDVVFNEAASKCTVCYDDPQLDMMVNGIGTLNVVEACNNSEVQLIHASTGSVMDNNPSSYYGVSKMSGEQYIRLNNRFNHKCLRYYHVFGSRQDDSDKGGVIPIFIRKIYHNEPIHIYGKGTQVRHFTSVYDVVTANMYAIDDTFMPDVINVISDTSVSIYSLAYKIMGILGKETEIIYDESKRGDIYTFPSVHNNRVGIRYSNDFDRELTKTVEWYVRKYEQEAK